VRFADIARDDQADTSPCPAPAYLGARICVRQLAAPSLGTSCACGPFTMSSTAGQVSFFPAHESSSSGATLPQNCTIASYPTEKWRLTRLQTRLAYSRAWHLIDVGNDPRPLGRVASSIAQTLMGKHKPIWNPSSTSSARAASAHLGRTFLFENHSTDNIAFYS
jgi:Ribosomal protein L13